MDQTERIAAMEQRLNRAQSALGQLEQAWEAYKGTQDDLAQLDAYLGSDQWQSDREADRLGLLPSTLHHGVLSEDAIWNLLEWQRELMEDIREGVGL